MNRNGVYFTFMGTPRSHTHRVKNLNGTVHYAENGLPSCGPIGTHKGWLSPSIATVTCKRCIAQFGADEPGHVDLSPTMDEHVARRAAERAARIAARETP